MAFACSQDSKIIPLAKTDDLHTEFVLRRHIIIVYEVSSAID